VALPLFYAKGEVAALPKQMILADSAGTLSVLQVIEQGITTGAIYALIAIGYTLVYGIIELINFAHGDVFMWGTLITFFMLQNLKISSAVNSPLHLALVVGGLMLLSMVGCALIALTVERVAYRPLRKSPSRVAPLISAIGASFILENLALFAIGPSSVNVPNIFPNQGLTILGVTIKYLDMFIILFAVLLMYGVATFINRTKIGRAMRSVSQDNEAASLMGVNINQVIIITFLLGGMLAGAASVVYAMRVQVAFYFTGFEAGLKAFTAAVLGGIGNLYGAMLGGLFIGLIEAFVTAYFQDSAKWADAIVFAVLVLVLVFRPSGLLGQQVPEKV
jgi:branched-chain amino acid transport system permease protein